MKKNKLLSNSGVSILEVLIALLITSIITVAILRLYVTQHKNYMVQDDISDIQQNVRSSLDELSRQIRLAGYALPLGLEGIEAFDTNPDTIIITYKDGTCDTYLSAPMPQPSAELKCGTDVSCFYDGQWVFIYDADSAKGEWFQITEVQSAALHIQHNTMTLSRKYDANALILALTQIKFFIDNTTEPDHPKLMVQLMGKDPQVYAENISDLQFSYRMKNGNLEDEPTLAENIREVQIEVNGHSNQPEVDEAGEEHFRNRSFSTSVYLRNIGI